MQIDYIPGYDSDDPDGSKNSKIIPFTVMEADEKLLKL